MGMKLTKWEKLRYIRHLTAAKVYYKERLARTATMVDVQTFNEALAECEETLKATREMATSD